MLHQDLARALAVERYPSRQHFVQNNSCRVDVDLFVIVAGGDFRRHVVDGAHALRLSRALTAADEFAQTVVADFHRAVLNEDVTRLKIAVNDAVIVQASHRFGQGDKPLLH